MCEEKSLGRFRCRDGQMRRIADKHPDSHSVPEEETSEKYDPLVPPNDTMADAGKRAIDAFVDASKKRWAKKK